MKTDDKTLKTRLAHAGWNDHRLRGRSLFKDVLGDHTSFWDLWSLSLGGPALNDTDRKVLDAMAVCNTAADPRIPPMKLIRLLSSYGSVMAGISGGFAYQENAIIGTWTLGISARDLTDICAAIRKDTSLTSSSDEKVERAIRGVLQQWAAEDRRPAGFGVPARPVDERVAALRKRMETLNRNSGRYWILAHRVEAALSRKRPLPLNIAGACGAACLDMGFKPRQIGVFAIAFAQHAFAGNAVEGAEDAPERLQKIPDSSISYTGPKDRLSPRAEAAREEASGAETSRGGPSVEDTRKK